DIAVDDISRTIRLMWVASSLALALFIGVRYWLGIRLGGPNDYFGQRVEKPWIGDAVRDIAVDDISRTIRLMWVASSLALALFIGVRYWL
ncbi:cobalamin biosynthesis protein CobD, partial [Klebsiella pneumoniae]